MAGSGGAAQRRAVCPRARGTRWAVAAPGKTACGSWVSSSQVGDRIEEFIVSFRKVFRGWLVSLTMNLGVSRKPVLLSLAHSFPCRPAGQRLCPRPVPLTHPRIPAPRREHKSHAGAGIFLKRLLLQHPSTPKVTLAPPLAAP